MSLFIFEEFIAIRSGWKKASSYFPILMFSNTTVGGGISDKIIVTFYWRDMLLSAGSYFDTDSSAFSFVDAF